MLTLIATVISTLFKAISAFFLMKVGRDSERQKNTIEEQKNYIDTRKRIEDATKSVDGSDVDDAINRLRERQSKS